MTFDLEYNSGRPLMIIPEYGRHIQKLVDHCLALETKEERDKMAKAIVDVMGNLQPHLRDVPDFKHKLWDQLYIMSDFKLDADSPYPIPSREELQEKPEGLPYPKYASKYRYYGNNIQTMIDIALSWEEGDKREALVFTIANHMKKCYLNWNKDTVDDAVIFKHLYDLSGEKFDLRNSDEELSESKNLLKKRNSQGQNTSKTIHKKPHHNNQNKNRKR
ncbi:MULTISPECIES: DUF4290 domain-containing protein [unclassified Polaribacter]|uniref:DUF4290 domain-containing protein n=1 Tax=unclassified Polaribacter TaxID=196858 RepID=UPI0011BF85D5|nr:MULTISPECIES: DUF4290 domain-containing protein [unclassified Polaribacter]TXD51508.1 DUF4290 domain-containing protein [Polaribacter sp. IC063]TXD58115.1 DUF4290 domain-containing protein [Polaribacter sp. IC066]